MCMVSQGLLLLPEWPVMQVLPLVPPGGAQAPETREVGGHPTATVGNSQGGLSNRSCSNRAGANCSAGTVGCFNCSNSSVLVVLPTAADAAADALLANTSIMPFLIVASATVCGSNEGC
mmetsp:Transcript_63295/g.125159  ORF Transcript_63295/g.125159 Transcript_63295/m.125159 type:complete len:119 (+) Transcript_63295:1022-1378(+)